MSSFIIYCGPMFSGKTTRLLNEIDRYNYKNKTVSVFKPTIDKRYSKTQIMTHNGIAIDAIQVSTGADIVEYILRLDVDECDVIAIDEAFMIDNISDALLFFFKHGKDIIMSTLDLSSSCEPFYEITKLLPYATCIKKFTAICTICGTDAHYTYKKEEDGNVISIGGSEKYEPRCWKHHPYINKRDFE